MQQIYTYARVNGITKIQDGISTPNDAQWMESYLVPEDKFYDFSMSMVNKYGEYWRTLFDCEERLDESDNLIFEFYRFPYSNKVDWQQLILGYSL